MTGNESVQLCYLCRMPMAPGRISRDHAVPKHLTASRQPKRKGYDYASWLPAHPECNNRFGPERYAAKALRLIAVLHDENCVSRFGHLKDPSIWMMTLNAECLKGFTHRDLKFFKMIDARDKTPADLRDPSFFSGKPKTDPTRDALFTALAVLTKSAAAMLVARHLRAIPDTWRVFAIPYGGVTEALDFDEEFGPTKPFAPGVKLWLRSLGSGDWFGVYTAHGVLVWFVFRLSEPSVPVSILARFQDAEPLRFEGSCLNDLIDYQWQHV